jgi:proteasome accessory factor C
VSRERADARLGRLLAIVPWVAAHDGPLLAEVCSRFGVEEKELVADLNLLFLCGVYPFTPDVLIDVDFSAGRVWIRMADYFRRPLRLNPQEGLALLAAADAFLKIPGAESEGPLATALAKLETVLGVSADEALDVELGPVAPATLELVRRAAENGQKMRIDYYSYGRDGYSRRVVRPWRVFNSSSNWYVSGWCEMAEDERLFRVDRITAVEILEETFERPYQVSAGPPAIFHPVPDDPLWVLDLSPGAHWIAEQYPHESVEARPGGVLRVALRVGERAWMERLLLRAGPDLTVVQGDPGVGRRASGRILGRYRRAESVK